MCDQKYDSRVTVKNEKIRKNLKGNNYAKKNQSWTIIS